MHLELNGATCTKCICGAYPSLDFRSSRGPRGQGDLGYPFSRDNDLGFREGTFKDLGVPILCITIWNSKMDV